MEDKAKQVDHDLAFLLEELDTRIDRLERNLGRVVAHLNQHALDKAVSEVD